VRGSVVEYLWASITLSRHVLVLALDTTTRSGSAAVVSDGELLCEIVGDGSRTHGERFPRDLMRVLEAASVGLDSIDLLAVAAGPGSFTGLRVGIAAMQGLAMSTGRKIVPVSALDALAAAAGSGSAPVAAWIDAQRGEVFAALYDSSGKRLLIEPSSLAPIRTLEAWDDALRGETVRIIGDGAARYEAAIRERLGGRAEVLPTPAIAGIIGRLAAASPTRAVSPHAVVPIYIRRPDAELARSRQSK
jgi:tRNA threonylcarbamoyladenosine biosynthesis protein TsaB